MKLELAPQDVQISGSFATSDYAIGDIGFIVDMFADKVYTHKERAVIRELSCNAHDSHTAAGTKKPFKVHLPTHLEPWFSIRDFGTGLDDKEVRTIFAGIGISTKRDSDEMIGCFGIGSLSPYSLCNSFTIKSWKDGVERTYSCYRDDQRKPVVALLFEVDSDQENGVEITLTVDGRVAKFEEEAINVFKWWDYTPEINSKNVVNRCDEWRLHYDLVGTDYGVSRGWGRMVAVMGNIAYQVPEELDNICCDGYVRFNLGEISFDTARENISLDEKTRAAIKTKFEKVFSEISGDVTKSIKHEPTRFRKAVAAYNMKLGQLGRFIKKSNTLDAYDLPKSEDIVYFRNYYKRSVDKGTTNVLPLGFKVEYYRHADRMQNRIRGYMKDRPESTLVVLTDKQIKETLIDEDVLQNLEDLPKPVRQPSSSSGASKVKTFKFNSLYNGYTSDNFYKEAEIECDGSEIVYIEISRWKPVPGNIIISGNNQQVKDTMKKLSDHGAGTTVVALKTAFIQSKTFKNGNFIHLDDYVKREFAKIAPKTLYLYNDSDAEKIKTLDKHIDQSELKEIVELIKTSKNSDLAEICERIGVVTDMKEDTSLQDRMDEFLEGYEMLTILDSWEISRNKEAVSRYIGGTLKTTK